MTTPTTNRERYLVDAFRKLTPKDQVKLLRQVKQATAPKH